MACCKDTVIRKALPGDAPAAAELAAALWPEHSVGSFIAEMESLLADEACAVFLCEKQGKAVGFAQCGLRHDYVEGTETSPVGYLEGIFVEESERRHGIARMLLSACESWAHGQGCTEFASDCELSNSESRCFHEAVGFREANRIVAYVRRL